MAAEQTRILVVDDASRIRTFCREVLELQSYVVQEAENGAQAIEIMKTSPFNLVLSDIMMPDIGGLELASIIREEYPDTFVILITGHGSIDMAKEAIQRGAFDFITKPFKMSELSQTVERALEVQKMQLSVLPSPELKDLYKLTVNANISGFSPDEFLTDLVDILSNTFRGDCARVHLIENDGSTSVYRTSRDGTDPLLEDRWEFFSNEALGSESGILAGEGLEYAMDPGSAATSLMAAAIPSTDGNLGTCLVARSTVPAAFTGRDLKLMGLFSAQAGNQLVNYRLASNLRKHADDLAQINRLTGDFSASLNTGQVLSSIGEGLRSMIPFDLFGVFLSGKDMLPLSYMLVRSDIPDTVLHEDLPHQLDKSDHQGSVKLLLEGGIRDSFACARVADWELPASVDVLDLGNFGSFSGMILLANWSPGSPIPKRSSYFPLLLRHAVAALSNAYLFETSERNYIQAISALAGAVDAKDPYTSNHSRNVAAYVVTIASFLKLPPREVSLLHNAALLHDIGKIGIPEAILNKDSSLTGEEYDIIKLHPEMGYRILRPVTAFGSFIEAVRYHHERFDGKGYPSGLLGDQTPYHARILAVADCFDAMTSDRMYRKSPGMEYAMSEISDHAGTQFDPDLSESFLQLLEERTPEEIIDSYISRGADRFTFS